MSYLSGRWSTFNYTYDFDIFDSDICRTRYGETQETTRAEIQLTEAIEAVVKDITTQPPSRKTTLMSNTIANVTRELSSTHRELLSENISSHDFVQQMNYLLERVLNAEFAANETIQEEDKAVLIKKSELTRNIPDARSSMFSPIGVEYTFHAIRRTIIKTDWWSRKGKSKRLEEAEEACQRVSDFMSEQLSKFSSVGEACVAMSYVDGDTVEICSPVHKTWKDMREWYRWMRKTLCGRVTVKNRKKGSGGTHINCAIPLMHGESFLYNLMVDIGNRPYINWIFNEPSDNHTANCMWDSKSMQHLVEEVDRKLLYRHSWGSWLKSGKMKKKISPFAVENFSGLGMRGNAIRLKSNKHYEFRCFDAVRNERDLKDIVAFVNAYCRWIYTQTLQGKRIITVGGHTGNLHRFAKTTRTDFNSLLSDIGLKPKDYRRFVDRNFVVRRDVYGKKYLI